MKYISCLYFLCYSNKKERVGIDFEEQNKENGNVLEWSGSVFTEFLMKNVKTGK